MATTKKNLRKQKNKRYYNKNRAKVLANAKTYYKEIILPNKINDELPVYYADKLCDKCVGRLELSRYKTCTICKPSLGDDYEPIQGNTIWETPDFRISEMSLLAGG